MCHVDPQYLEILLLILYFTGLFSSSCKTKSPLSLTIKFELLD